MNAVLEFKCWIKIKGFVIFILQIFLGNLMGFTFVFHSIFNLIGLVSIGTSGVVMIIMSAN